MMPNPPPFRTISSRTVHKTSWVELVEHEAEITATGRRFTYTYLESSPSVMVVAVSPEGKIPLIRQFRYPTQSFSYELPGGGSAGMTPDQAALAELEEETGYRAGRIRKVGEFIVYCGLSDEVCHAYFAEDLVPGEQKLEETEHIEVCEFTPAEVEAMVRDGELRDGMALAALHLAREALAGREAAGS